MPVIADGDTLFVATTPGAARSGLTSRGWVFARIDSVASGAVYVEPGPLVMVGGVAVDADSLDLSSVALRTRPGAPLDSAALALDLRNLISAARARGFADARITARTDIEGDPPKYVVSIRLDAGEREPLAGVVLDGARRASPSFALRASGLVAGPLPDTGIDLAAVRQRLDALGVFARVGEPSLARDADGRLVVRVPVEEGPPGVADLVLGYLPPASGASGQVVGSGRVELLSPFGGGRRLRVALDRDPGLSSRLDAEFSDPFILGLPLGAGLRFQGEGRDSTYSRQRLRAEAAARIGGGLEIALTAAGESVQPGRAGSRLAGDGRPVVRRSDALFGGVAIRFVSVDRRRSPRRGLTVTSLVEQGVRVRAATDAVEETRVSQQRLDAAVRIYRPLAGRVVGVLGVDAEVVLAGLADAGGFDEGELVR
ncbi:MAG: hypothetical protein AAFQ43_13435, partial [Bacteroidota bacterium]